MKSKLTRKASKKNNKFKIATCSPYVHDKLKGKKTRSKKQFDFSCYDKDMLLLLKEAWNSRHPDCKITSKNYKKIWEQLRDRMNNTCDIESCWYKELLNDPEKNNKLGNKIKKLFAPRKPYLLRKDPNNVIDSLDITRIMKQYEDMYDYFKFIGPSPIDFDTHLSNGECVWKELCELRVGLYVGEGIRVIGMILNLDNHKEEGSHWVSLILDLNRRELCYFCSYGSYWEPEIGELINKIKLQCNELNIPLKTSYNKKRFQGDTNECGFYCMYVIINMIHGKCFKQIVKSKLNDNLMNKLRLTYFYNDDNT